MLMIADSPTKDFFTQRMTRDSGLSPSFRPRHCTPPRLVSVSSDPSFCDSPMLTPSPLRHLPLFHSTFNPSQDDTFLQSPFKSPPPTFRPQPFFSSVPHPIVPADDGGAVFLSSSSVTSSFSPRFPAPSSQPLRTPVKRVHRMSSRPTLPPSRLSSPTFLDSSESPQEPLCVASNISVGTKRKSTSHLSSTPVHQPATFPLSPVTNSTTLNCLAPFPAPKFVATTPQSKADTDAYLRRQTTTLTRLRITDPNNSPDFQGIDNDSGCKMEDGNHHRGTLFSSEIRPSQSGAKTSSCVQFLDVKPKGRGKEEVAEAISPGGHITKRRARRRPLSAELLESARQSSSPNKNNRTRVAFPSTAHGRKRTSSPSSESDTARSSLPRRRLGNMHPLKPAPPRGMSRQDNLSAASLFFGPSIPLSKPTLLRSRTNTISLSSTSTPAPFSPGIVPKLSNRHSYAGPSGSAMNAWNTIQSKTLSLSPESSPPAAVRSNTDEDIFFGTGLQESSFIFSVTEGTPPSRSKKAEVTSLPRKYKPRDSGVVMSDDDDDGDSMCLGGDYVSVDAPPCVPLDGISRPNESLGFVPSALHSPDSSGPNIASAEGSGTAADCPNIDLFIMRTLAAASKGQKNTRKKIPGTPVKRNKTQHLASGARPWQSAVAAKVGVRFDWDAKKGKAPRPSLPAAFPAFRKKTGKLTLDHDSDSEGPEESPGRRREKYVGLGLGRPAAAPSGELKTRTRWLMRRSSSGAFSSGSESLSSSGTPTRLKSKEWHLTTPAVPILFSSAANPLKLPSGRSASSSSTSSTTTLNSPSIPTSRRAAIGGGPRRPAHHDIPRVRRLSELSPDEQFGRFERDFLVEDEIGSGEFGKVIKVHRKNSDDYEVYAIKKSKRFEGPRHRLRLREEVEVLQHISLLAARASYEQGRHPNVLAYIDSWEEDEALYIQTELCDSGNLAQFLWEFGRTYPRLDEDRVWKIIVDLSNGLRFIHDAGIIHLDLKPSNIFITAKGRFKIGDFGMASFWPRPRQPDAMLGGGFEREGDKLYLAPEVLQGNYSKSADMFSLGMTILETASNIVVPDQGEAWHRLRQEDFSQVDLDGSPELLGLIREMMRTEPSVRMDVHGVYEHPVVSRARMIMEGLYLTAKRDGGSFFAASPLGSVHAEFLEEILGHGVESSGMDTSV